MKRLLKVQAVFAVLILIFKSFKSFQYNAILAVILTSLLFLPSVLKAQYTINTVHANLTDCDTLTRGIFIVWWDKDFNYSEQANVMLDSMLVFREVCINKLGMKDPLNAQNGFYCNIYIHVPGNPADFFSTNFPGWGNGVGGDSHGYPFMTLPNFILGNSSNLAHETFHIMQSNGMWNVTPGIYRTDDGGWFVEASAQWFRYSRYPKDLSSFVESEILVRVPHVPLWLGFQNFPGNYPNNWQRGVHQYALSTYLYYLTNTVGISDSSLVSVFYSGTSLLPQEYLYHQIGGAAFRNHFIDCAAHMTNNFDFILPSQANKARIEWNRYADPSDDNRFIQTYVNIGSDGWFRPEDQRTTNAWSFNTYKVSNSSRATYTFELNGYPTGTSGDHSFFQGKVLVKNRVSGASFHDLVMRDDSQGALTLNVTPDDTEVYFIIAAMPEVFEDKNPTFQRFPYEMRITYQNTTGIEETGISSPKFEITRCNILGQKIDKDLGGLQVIFYNDGSKEQVFIQKRE